MQVRDKVDNFDMLKVFVRKVRMSCTMGNQRAICAASQRFVLLIHFQVISSIVAAVTRVPNFRRPFVGIGNRGLRHSPFSFLLPMTPFASAVLESPSAERNKGAIWDVLSKKVLPIASPISRVLEIAAGCGVHTIYFASQLLSETEQQQQQNQEGFTWLPTDPDYESRLSIDERVRIMCPDNRLQLCIQPAQSLTLNEHGSVENYWRSSSSTNKTISSSSITPGNVDLVISINQIHISPWTATIGLMLTASRLLKSGGVLYCYGPYKEGGTAVESNLAFDQSLRSRDPSWGLRDLEQVILTAAEYGLVFQEKVEMPANNLSVIFVKK